ncbi:MAG: hypothetical protein J5858_16550, partial [Lentisphaeria bacterium]|nr:hypothetical protein [Lentisphaeria bacterium]
GSTFATQAGGYHNGPSITLLMSQNYNTDYKAYVCPSGTLNGIKPETNILSSTDAGDYILQAKATDAGGVAQTNLSYGFIANMNENDSPDSGMSFDCGYEIASGKSNHDKFGNVVFVDGSVRQYAGENWASNIAYYGVSTTSAGTIPLKTGTSDAPGLFKYTSGNHTTAPSNQDGKLIAD